MQTRQLTLTPIGHVTTDKEGFVLEIERPLRPALAGLRGFSHLDVLWWCNHVDTPECRRILECDKPYRNGPARLGIFATRSPVRPNPIALTAVPVLDLDEEHGRIRVAFIDALDGSPILDLKPYHPATDRVRRVSVPAWCGHWPEWYEDSASFDWQSELVHQR